MLYQSKKESLQSVNDSRTQRRFKSWTGCLLLKPNCRKKFQLLLKGCTIEARVIPDAAEGKKFQLLLKGCTIEATKRRISERLT